MFCFTMSDEVNVPAAAWHKTWRGVARVGRAVNNQAVAITRGERTMHWCLSLPFIFIGTRGRL